MRQLLHLAATHGRILLVGGILAGVLLPDVGLVMRPWLGMLVALLLFLAAFRIGPKAAVGGLRDFGSSAVFVVVTQLALPLAAAGIFALAGMIDSVVAMAIVLMLAAPSISGSANFSILVGHDPAPALRLAVFGTAAFPLTALLVFWLLPGVEGDTVLPAALRLLLTIALATGLAFALRGVMPPLSDENRIALDGFSALTLAVTAIGLVSALGPALWNSPASRPWLDRSRLSCELRTATHNSALAPAFARRSAFRDCRRKPQRRPISRCSTPRAVGPVTCFHWCLPIAHVFDSTASWPGFWALLRSAGAQLASYPVAIVWRDCSYPQRKAPQERRHQNRGDCLGA